MSESQRRGSIAPPLPSPAATSPFNGVKLRLALLLLGGMALVVILARLAPSPGVQLAALAVYGLGSMVWTIARTCRILRASRRGPH